MWTVLILLLCVSAVLGLSRAASGTLGLRRSVGRSSQSLLLKCCATASVSGTGTDTKTIPVPSSSLDPPPRRPSFAQASSLLVLVAQTTALAICMRISRRKGGTSGLYVSSAAVCVVELIKLLVSIILYRLVENGRYRDIFADLKSLRNWRFSIPAGLYVVQNNLQYIAMGHLSPVVYQVFIQLKVVAAAIFSEKLLNKRHSAKQWSAIVGLTAGLGLVQLALTTSGNGKLGSSGAATTVGLAAVLLSCGTSGVAGVYSEKLVKSSPSKLWGLNIQMSFFGFLLSLGVLVKDFRQLVRNGSVLYGFTPIVWITVMLHALGGLVTAFVVKSTSSVVKGFAQSFSVVVSCLISHFILKDFRASPLFLLGALIVCISAIVFTLPQEKKTS